MGMRPNEDVAWLLQRLNAGEEGERGRLMEAVPDQMIDLDDVADFVACLLTLG